MITCNLYWKCIATLIDNIQNVTPRILGYCIQLKLKGYKYLFNQCMWSPGCYYIQINGYWELLSLYQNTSIYISFKMKKSLGYEQNCLGS